MFITENNRIHVTRDELNSIFNIGKRTLNYWFTRGLSPTIKVTSQIYDLIGVIQWYMAYKDGEGYSEKTENSLAELKRQQALINLESSKMDLAEKQEKMVDSDSVKSEWFKYILQFWIGFQARVDRLPALLVGKEEHEIYDELARYDNELMEEFKETGKWTDLSNLTGKEKEQILKYIEEVKSQIL